VSLSQERVTVPVDPGMILLKMGRDTKGRLLAVAFVIADGDVIVLDVELVESHDEGWAWYEKVRVEQPWVERH